MKNKGANNKQRVRQRQEEAVLRQEVYDKRTPQQQLELIKTRLGESKKEKYRLTELINFKHTKSKRDPRR